MQPKIRIRVRCDGTNRQSSYIDDKVTIRGIATLECENSTGFKAAVQLFCPDVDAIGWMVAGKEYDLEITPAAE